MNLVFLSYLKALAVLPVLSAALHVPISQVGRRGLSTHEKRQSSANNTNGLDLTTVRDLIYMSSMTAGGKEYLVQMDTGSSDVWLKGDIHPLTNSKQTSITANLTFGIGWVSGTVSHIPVEFAGVSIPSQAYLDVTEADNPALSYNADGLIGLGFTSLSTIDSMVNATGSSDGRSLLFNLFESDPEQDNFIAFSFQRSTDDQDEVQGGFSIGEYEENYTSIADTAKISTWPTVAPKRWNILVEAFIVGDKEVIPSTIVPDVPGNKAVALLDTGTSYSYVPKEICDAIYSGIEGTSYNADTGYWSVPCSAEIDMAIQIAGRTFPLHPLDVSPSAYQGDNTCIGSFVPETIAADTDQFDYIFGVNVLRSMYSLYDFGDFDSNEKMGDPYIKLLSLTDPDDASAAFCSSRTCTPRTGITYKTSSNTEDGPVMSVSVSGSTAEALQKFTTWFPAMLGIMALNALVLLGLLILGIVLTIRKCRTKKARVRHPASRPLRDSSGGQNHTYEPVSMAMTEDTMVPPMPAFHKFEGSTLRPGDRPKSLATLPSNSKEYEDDTEETLLSPGFKHFDMRPRSVGAFPAQSNTYQKGGVDEPFIPPYQVPQNEGGHIVPRPSSQRSPSMGSSNHSQSDDANSPSPSHHEDAPPLHPSPSARSIHESTRPSSRYVDQQQPSTPPSIHVSQTVEETVPLPPSPSIRSFRDSSRPSSRYMVEPGQPSPPPPRLSPLAGANVASLGQEDQILAPPRPSFRPRVPSAGDRPQSTVVLPSQTNNPYRPDARRLPSQSSLRPRGGNPTDDRPMSSAY